MVGIVGLEPTATWTQIMPSTKLTYIPMYMVKLFETQPYNKNLNINLDIPISELSEYKHYIYLEALPKKVYQP